MPSGPFLALGLLALALPASAQVYDESDLRGSRESDRADELLREARRADGTRVFSAQTLPRRPAVAPPSGKAAAGSLVFVDPAGREQPGRGARVLLVASGRTLATAETDGSGTFLIEPPAGATGAASLRLRLENTRWAIREPQSDSPYEWELAALELPLAGPTALPPFRLDPASRNGKIAFIHLQFLRALDAFARAGLPLDWWTKTLGVNYPGSSDFFSPWAFTVDLTAAEAWDVNLHELGHAVMDAGTRSRGGGGSHKIDECYSPGLAWSEGFATFFAGVAALDPGDPDARFEFLVPRRAPIRIENVPGDVCRGDTNEWRVAAGLWDLYDSHADGADAAALGWERLWSAIQGQALGGFGDAWARIRSALKPEEIAGAEAGLRQNTLLGAAPAAAAPRLPAPADLRSLAAPAWD